MSKYINEIRRLTERSDKLANKVRFWRVMAIAQAGMLAAIWANHYVFGVAV